MVKFLAYTIWLSALPAVQFLVMPTQRPSWQVRVQGCSFEPLQPRVLTSP